MKQVKEVKNIKQLADIVLALTKSVNALIRNSHLEIDYRVINRYKDRGTL